MVCKHESPTLGRFSRLAGTAGLAMMMAMTAAHAQTVVTWMYPEANPSVIAEWEALVAEYEAANPGVDVQMQFLENEAFKAKMPTLLQSADAPHFFYSWGGGVLKAQSETGALMDLTEAMEANDGAWKNTYVPASFDSLTVNDRIWAVPHSMGTVSFFYNKELFQQAGVDGDGIETWEDLLGAITQLKEAGIVPIAGGGGEKWPIHFYWSYLVMRNGGQDVFADAKNGEGEGFMHPAIVKAGEMLAELGALEPFQPGWLAANWPETQGIFGDGKAAMLLGFQNTETAQRNAAADGVGLAAENIGRFPFPEVEGGAGAVTDTLGGLNGWAVTRNAPPEALDFLAFFTSADAQRRLAQAKFLIPVAKGAEDGVTDPLLAQAAAQLAASTWHQNYFDQDLGPSIGRVVNDVSVEIAAGNMTGEEGARMIQEAFELEQF
jgi:raffinose/stachyose/melibiose transport system substrate-binding protein